MSGHPGALGHGDPPGVAAWPLVLAGPMPRRVSPDAVSVFVACKHPRTVRLSLYDGAGRDRLLHQAQAPTRPLGRFLHVAVVTAWPPEPLPPGRVYGYDLAFVRAPGQPGDDGDAEADLGLLGLLDQLGYGRLPSLVVPPERLEQVRIVHGSCRKPHGERRDALATLDQILATTHADATARPQQLFLTGDQIYADDMEPALLTLAGAVGRAALGWEDPEVLPEVGDDFRLAPTRRDHVVRRAGFSGPVLHSHLMSLAEFYGMYLLNWSDALWPRDAAGRPTLPPVAAVLDHPRWREPAHRRAYARATALAARHRADVLEFARSLPRVRRALANIATYMIFDDHDVTDDWNLHRRWRTTVERRPLGRRLVQNALSAYAVFQGWGNEPARFEPGEAGGELLAALAAWDGTEGGVCDAIRARLGMPAAAAATPVRWDYQVDTPSYQVIVLDTRTQRGYRPEGNGLAAPALLGEAAMHQQLTSRLASRDREVPVTVIVSAAPVFGHPLIEARVQLKRIKAIEWFEQWPAAVDREAWSLHTAAFESLLRTLVGFGRVVLLSGDVHYGFAGTVEYWDWRDGERRARFVQCTSSPLKNEDRKTRLLGGVGTVAQVPAVLGSRVEKVLARLTTPPSLTFLGWSTADLHARRLPLRGRGLPRTSPVVLPSPLAAAHRILAAPEWRYRVDFQADVDAEPHAPGRVGEAHRRARELRAEHRWSLMHTVVGRNNLGDIEFLATGGEPGTTPGVVRQSLWFDKTSIRSGTEPDRLPYTVYDLPLTPPAPDDQRAPSP
jgi:PhoD-like phosphatase